MFDLSHTFVTSDHHFRAWKNCPLHGGSTEEDEMRQIALWNSVVGKDDRVLYIGDFYDSVPESSDGAVADLMDLIGKLNGQIVLIKGNHEKLDDAIYRLVFRDVMEEMRINELKLLLIHKPDKAKLRPGELMIYGHEHRGYVPLPTTSDSICVCAKWHGWKPLSLAEAMRQMDAASTTP